MIVRLNIGLENASKFDFDCDTIARLLDLATRDCAELLSYRQVESSGGDWEPESILWAELEVSSSDQVHFFRKSLEGLCTVLNEEGIAVAIVSPAIAIGEGIIVWNPEYNGEKYDFNLDYFTE